jgi:integrase
MEPNRNSPNREYIVPVLFRMMYCCGMRPFEPPSLLIEDVNLQSGEIYINVKKSPGWISLRHDKKAFKKLD